jgi:hypothetical protein
MPAGKASAIHRERAFERARLLAEDLFHRLPLGEFVDEGTDESYLRVRLDDPAWPHPIWGALLETTEDGVVRLVWRRKEDG